MNDVRRTNTRVPIGSLVLIALMYPPWLIYFSQPRAAPGENSFEFPGSFLLVLFGLCYLAAAIALPIRLYRRRDLSRWHRAAFYTSLGILGLFIILFWIAR